MDEEISKVVEEGAARGLLSSKGDEIENDNTGPFGPACRTGPAVSPPPMIRRIHVPWRAGPADRHPVARQLRSPPTCRTWSATRPRRTGPDPAQAPWQTIRTGPLGPGPFLQH
ncbi:hypothetical protein LWI29_022463 [Acer saccharum]|uniref:Uncharacterized protein n=1 Tax=Acer saccharum TaxID=4024 RepID=A0AA39S1H4_ACESA|nr:hypothetical protein LWI29_022463 [Acer saccharum]